MHYKHARRDGLALPPRKPPGSVATPVADRFWDKVAKTDGCWEWTAARTPHGYGVMGGHGSRGNMLANRVSWEIHNGQIPAGVCVLHRCDNPPCVRPDHLFLGTAKDNVMDCVKKGRHRAVLDASSVRAIRSERLAGAKLRILAERYGVSETMISRISRRTAWAHV